MVTRLSDNREFEAASVEEADRIFEELALLEVQINNKKAAAEKRIAEIKAKYEADTADLNDGYQERVKWLNSYILANKGRFVKPRMRKTDFGRYGLRTATKLTISDEQAVIAAARDNELDDVIELKYRINKKAVEKHISEGIDMKGARIVSGDVAGFSVDKHLKTPEAEQ